MSGETGREERTWAMLAHLLKLVAPMVAPLAIYVARRDGSPFVAAHALQSLYVDLAWIGLTTVSVVLALLLSFVPFLGQLFYVQFLLTAIVLFVAWLILTILFSVKAFNGETLNLACCGIGGPAEPAAGEAPEAPSDPEAAAAEAPGGEPRRRRGASRPAPE